MHGFAGFPAPAARGGGARLRAAARCPCGARITGDGACWVRWHLFWDCFVARSLREEMGAARGPAVGALDAAFQCRHLWLADAPPGLHPAVWEVVALAAVAALPWNAAASVYTMCGTHTRTALPRARLVSNAAEVVADFWARLASFASQGIAPRG